MFPRSQSATARGSNRTAVPTLKFGSWPALAIRQTVTGLTQSNFATSAAVIARLIRSIRCGNEQLSGIEISSAHSSEDSERNALVRITTLALICPARERMVKRKQCLD